MYSLYFGREFFPTKYEILDPEMTDDEKYLLVKGALDSQGNFEVRAALGKGAFGQVVEAKCNDDGKSYAIKIVPYHGENAIKYQEREVQLLTSLELSERQQNVIKYFNSWFLQVKEERFLCIRMELCYTSLIKLVGDKKIGGPKIVQAQGPPRFYQQVFRQILKGLKAIHAMHWVHRDIHPGNILIANPKPQQISDINVKIADFGLARHVGVQFDVTAGLTILPKLEKLSPIAGNRLFRAPELQSEHYDFKVDVYSAGMVLYYISYDHPDTSQWTSELQALKNGKLNIEEKLRDKNDEKLCHLIENLIQHDPTKRFSARDAKKYMFPKEAKDSVDAKASIYFLVRKENEEELRESRLQDINLSAIKEAVKAATGIENQEQVLVQVRVVNGEKRSIKMDCDEDVRNIFNRAAKDKREVEVVVSQMQVSHESNDTEMIPASSEPRSDDSQSSQSL